MIKDDEICVCFCSPAVAKQLDLPDDTMIVTGLLSDDEIVVTPKQEFLDWLYQTGQHANVEVI